MSTTFAEIFSRLVRSPGFKFFLVALLVLVLTIPMLLVWALVQERSHRATSVQRDIAQLWGAQQKLLGPYLIVPYTVKLETSVGDKTTVRTEERRAIFLPERLSISGQANTEIRHRSIYDFTVYSSDLKISGRFPRPDILKVEVGANEVRWKDAIVALGISDVSGLKQSSALQVGAKSLPFEPSFGLPNHRKNGIHVRLFDTGATISEPPEAFDFTMTLSFAGSSSLTFSPVARETEVQLKSDWPHPSFTGAFLPTKRDISADGFTATWNIPHLARSVPQEWKLNQNAYNLDPFTASKFGVRFFVPIDYYDLVERAAKYAIMFISIAFGAVFLLEMLAGTRVHAVQYIFVGLAMVFFYILLLSVAEHWGFLRAYLLSAVATGGLISLYVGKAMRSAQKGFIMLAVFLFLYGLLYLILQLEDYALLAGALAGFILLAAAMFATLRINWSGDETAPGSPPPHTT